MNDKPEEMQEFFNSVVDGYDEHMVSTVQDYETFYNTIAFPFPNTDDSIEILDLGAGTGIELSYIFAKAPKAKITAIDLSPLMLNKLVDKFEKFGSQIKIVVDSYLSVPMDECAFDYIVSIMSLHHLLPMEKALLYKKIRKALSPKGIYIEGDYIVSDEEQDRLLKKFHLLKKDFSLEEELPYHVDIPFSERSQIRALRRAGFEEVEVLFRSSRSNIVVAKPEKI